MTKEREAVLHKTWKSMSSALVLTLNALSHRFEDDADMTQLRNPLDAFANE